MEVFGTIGGDLPVMVHGRKPKGKTVERSTRQDFGVNKRVRRGDGGCRGSVRPPGAAACGWRDSGEYRRPQVLPAFQANGGINGVERSPRQK
ncbi:hypothetical protein GCM10027018_19740 [Paenibacillus thermoaerophilus]